MIARTLIAMTAAALLSSCGTVNMTVGQLSPFKMKTAALVPQDANSPETDAVVREQLMAHSIAPQPPLPRGTRQSSDVDLIVTYSEQRQTERPAQLDAISVSMFEATTGNLLVTARWEKSALQLSSKRSEVVKELINDVMAKVSER